MGEREGERVRRCFLNKNFHLKVTMKGTYQVVNGYFLCYKVDMKA